MTGTITGWNMTGAARLAAAGLAAALLTGCAEEETKYTTGNDKEIDVRFGVLEPTKDDSVVRPAGDSVKTLILRATRVELGTTRQGKLLTAYGEVADSGWYQPALTARNDGLPGPDGFIEFDFVAADPVVNGLPPAPLGTAEQREVRAVTVIYRESLNIAVGLRVNSESGPIAVRFARADSELPPPPGG